MTNMDQIIQATRNASSRWNASKVPVQAKTLVNQLTSDIQSYINEGYWDFALKLSSYRHEIAKIYNCMDWYEPFLEVRKVRDLIALIANDTEQATNSGP